MTDRRDFWVKASPEQIAQVCQDHGLRRIAPQVERTILSVTDLFATPVGALDRQLIRGQAFTIHAVNDDGWAYGETTASRYSGWVNCADLYTHPKASPTHRVSTRQSYGKSTTGLKRAGRITPLSLGSELVVLDEAGGWSRVAWERGLRPSNAFVPSVHLVPVEQTESDPVAVAERLIGTPYLWGGNSAFGIDCSGLVQIACDACGIPCPGDSDQQCAQLGETLDPGTPPQRGDLLFWKGHVGWVSDPDTLLHANAHSMSVTCEPLQAAIERIAAQGDPVLRHARLTLGGKGV